MIDGCAAQKKGLTAKYADLWAADGFSKITIAKELIFCYRYYKSSDGDNYVEANNYPVGVEGGNGGTCPTQNLVDAYEMKNGKSIDDPTSGYNAADPYKAVTPVSELL